MKTYILQQDTPCFPKGTEIKPLSALAYGISDNDKGHLEFRKEVVERDNGAWFKLKDEEKIKVTGLQIGIDMMDLANGLHYALTLNQPIPDNKYEAVEKAIEFVLNNRDNSPDPKKYVAYDEWNPNKIYTEQELLEAEEKAVKKAIMFFRTVNPANAMLNYKVTKEKGGIFTNDELYDYFVECTKNTNTEYPSLHSSHVSDAE